MAEYIGKRAEFGFTDLDPDQTPLPLPLGDIDLQEKAEELGIRYFLVSYSTLNSDSRVSVVPKRAIRDVQRRGCGVPAAMFFKADGADPEMNIVPDPKTLIQLPWKPEYGWLSSNLYLNGKPFSQCPRRALIRQMEKARRLGYVMKSGVEPEFTLLNKDGSAVGDALDAQQPMSLQEPLAIMRNSDVIMKIYDVMEKLNWEPYEVDHEAACCQYEINYGFADALTTADRHAFMKFMIKEIAELEGYRITFMPVPLPNLLCSNGLHNNVSLWRLSDGKNAFPDPSDSQLGLSQTAYHFLGGLLDHVEDSCAFLCPTVNSYKRLNLGAWCPNTVSWGGNNRTVLLRVPADNRIEHRLADGSSNPHLTQAVVLAAGLDGIEKKTDPGERTDFEVYKHPERFRKMPTTLAEALQLLNASKFLRGALGDAIVDGFIYVKQKEWTGFHSHISQWERDFYLNC